MLALKLSLLMLASIILVGASVSQYAQNRKTKPFEVGFDVPSLILAKRCADRKSCWTWTVTSRLGQTLELAENLFGERDKSYTILGIEFAERGEPSLWYPGNKKDIIIQLTQNAAHNEMNALYQLSHETFHLLSPGEERDDAIILVEGLATYFSVTYMEYIEKPIPDAYLGSSDDKYRMAFNDIVELVKLHPDTAEKIKTLRKKNFSVSNMTYEQFKQTFPKAPDKLAKKLTSRFYLPGE